MILYVPSPRDTNLQRTWGRSRDRRLECGLFSAAIFLRYAAAGLVSAVFRMGRRTPGLRDSPLGDGHRAESPGEDGDAFIVSGARPYLGQHLVPLYQHRGSFSGLRAVETPSPHPTPGSVGRVFCPEAPFFVPVSVRKQPDHGPDALPRELLGLGKSDVLPADVIPLHFEQPVALGGTVAVAPLPGEPSLPPPTSA